VDVGGGGVESMRRGRSGGFVNTDIAIDGEKLFDIIYGTQIALIIFLRILVDYRCV